MGWEINATTGGGMTPINTFRDMFRNMFKGNPFGWTNFFMFFMLVTLLFAFGPRNAGMALLTTGGVFAFLNVVVFTTSIFAVSLCVLFVVLGILVIWQTHRRET